MEKHALQSKTNWAQIAALLIGIAVVAGWIPEPYEKLLIELALICIPPITIAFRSWLTENPLRWK